MQRRDFVTGSLALGLGNTPSYAAQNQSPVALSIGISNFDNGPNLPSANRDARLMARIFTELGFDSTLLIDVDSHTALLGLARLRLNAVNVPFVAIYVASHGLMAAGQTHVLCKETDFALPFKTALPESIFLKAVSDRPRQKLLFLDACREQPMLATYGHSSISAPFPKRAGAYISYASQSGAPALDGIDGHSPFAYALARALLKPNLTVSEIALAVRLHVLRQTSGRQIPWTRSSLLTPLIPNPS